jgi:dTDP-4-dehydrorhamnose reductase
MASLLVSGKRVKAAFDQVFCPTLVSDVVYAVALLQAKGVTGIVNVCSSEPFSRYELAVKMAQALDIDPAQIDRVALSELGFKSNRPKNTSMVPRRLLQATGISFVPIEQCINKAAKNWKGGRYAG